MVKEQYRKELEQVKLNDEQMARLVEMMAAPPVQKVRHVGRTILAAAVLAALLSVAALAVSPTLRQTCWGISPPTVRRWRGCPWRTRASGCRWSKRLPMKPVGAFIWSSRI